MRRSIASVVALVAVLLAASVGVSASGAKPSPKVEARATVMIKDWYDGRIDGRYSCAVAHAAYDRIPKDAVYSTGPGDFRRYGRRVCPKAASSWTQGQQN